MAGRRNTRISKSAVDVVFLINSSTTRAKMGAEGIYVYLEKTDGCLEKRDGFSAPWAVRGKTAGVQGTARGVSIIKHRT